MWNGLFRRESRETTDGGARIGSDEKEDQRPRRQRSSAKNLGGPPPAPDRHRLNRRASYRRQVSSGHSNDDSESEDLSMTKKAKAKAARRAQHAPMSEDDNNTAATASTSSLSSSSSASSSASSGSSIARTGTTNASMPHLTMQWSQNDERNEHPMTAFPRLSAQEAEDRIKSMRHQEDGPSLGDGGIGNGGPYRTRDYFRTLRRRAARSSGCSTNTKAREELVDEECRIKMTTWCYQVVDHCKIDRECVCIAASYLDRYLITKPGKRALSDRRLFQLAAMTALYMSLKLFEDVNVEPKVMCGLSRGGYTEAEFTDMELDMLMSLRWHVHPPTAVSFVGHFLSLFPSVVGPSSSSRISSSSSSYSSSYSSRSPRSPSSYSSRSPRSRPSGCDECHREAEAQRQDLIVELYDCSKYQCELSVNDPTFLGTSQSTIALASLLNAIELFAPPDSMWGHSSEMMSAFLRRVEMAASMKVHSAGVLEAREKLHLAAAASLGVGRNVPLRASSFSGTTETEGEEEMDEEQLKRRESEGQLSPRCASFGM